MNKFFKKSEAKFEGVHPDLIKLCRRALEISPIDFGIIQGVRTPQYQEALYAQGRSSLQVVNELRRKVDLEPLTLDQNKKPVTQTRASNHIKQKDGFGHAIDFAAYHDGKITWDEPFYRTIGDAFLKAAKELKIAIKWGGMWSFPDWGHIELDGNVYR